MKKSLVLFGLIFLIMTMVWAGVLRESSLGEMNVTVINVDKQGYFNYFGRISKKIERGEKVVWICNAPFTVYFGKESPIVSSAKAIPAWGKTMRGIQAQVLDERIFQDLKRRLTVLDHMLKDPPENLCKMKLTRLGFLRDQLKMALKKSSEGKCYIASAWVSKNALSGSYKYIIAAYAYDKVWVDDPEDIIDPPPR
jgi:hypothetical protein